MFSNKILLWPLGLLCLLALPVAAAEKPTLPAQWTIQQAVRFSLENNPDMKIAQLRIQAAASAVTASQSTYFPLLSPSAGYTRTNNPMYSFGNILTQGQFTQSIDFNNPGITDDLNLTAQAQYRLYNGGKDKAGIQAAQDRKNASHYQREAVRLRLGFAVVKNFYSIVQARENVQARKSSLQAISASLQTAQARFEAGDLLKADLLNLQVQQSRASENLIRARHGLELARRGLLNLLGLQQQKIRLATDKQTKQAIPQKPSFEHRPELAALDASISAARAELRQAQAGKLPTADIFGSYQMDKGFAYNEGSGNSWMAGVKLNYNLFDGHRTSAAIAGARAMLGQLQQQRHQLELAFGYEIQQAQLALQLARQRLEVTRNMLQQADESARLSRERFKEGVILAADLIEVENRLTDARVHNFMATASRHIAIATLRKACGLPQFSATSALASQQH